jgi:histidine triad (HIT) family protein
MSEGCIFCKIVRKEVPASIVYEDGEVIAFLDIRPVSEGHVLVIPKAHFETIFDTPEELLAQIYKITKKVAEAVKKGVKADGISIIQQNGRAADQDVFHLHVHVIPRAMGQKLQHFDKLADASREKLDKAAIKIRDSLS